MADPTGNVTRLLNRAHNDRAAQEELFVLVQAELRRRAKQLMRNETPSPTLQPTMLVNDAFLELVGHSSPTCENRQHFYRLASRAMRQLLVDHARSRNAGKRGGGERPVPLDQIAEPGCAQVLDLETVLAIHEALERLAQRHPELAELVELRHYGGQTLEDIAQLLGISLETVKRRWRIAKAYLHRDLAPGEAPS